MKITIEVVPHQTQRYPTVGDWSWDKNGNLNIKISSMKNWKYECCVAIHELVEVLLCKDRGITEEQVTNFDLQYEALRKEDDTTSEPGDSPDAPYKFEHFFATNIERQLALELCIDWSEYEKTIYSL